MPGETSFRFAGSDASLPRVLGFHEGFQMVQALSPKDAVLLDPGINRAQRLGIELVNAVAAFAMLAHQMGAAEKTQMLGNGGARDGEGAGDLSGRLSTSAQEVENRAAGGIGQGLEGGCGVTGRRICNRSVTHNV
jgi:hypothetical protein